MIQLERKMQTILILSMACIFGDVVSYHSRCPTFLEWKYKSTSVCPKDLPDKYYCLFNTLTEKYKEGCDGPDFDRSGTKRVYSGEFNRASCSEHRYQPFKFWTNGSSECVYKKSMCAEEGQVTVLNNEPKMDVICRCDHTRGYSFVFKPNNICGCVPSKEDCSCYRSRCSTNTTLSADYVCKQGNHKSHDLLQIHCPNIRISYSPNKEQHNMNKDILEKTETERSFLSVEHICILFTIVCILLMVPCVVFFDRIYERSSCSKVDKNEQDTSTQITDPAVVSLQQEMDRFKHICEQKVKTADSIAEYSKQLQDRYKEKNKWKSVPVKLAVTGVSGVGKSSFINAIRNVKKGDDDVAKSSSSGNTTTKPTPYTFPQNKMITIYDLPGYGTPECPTTEYEIRMELNTFDYIFLFVGNLTENDIEIGRKLQDLGKPFCIVRSKIDDDFARTKKDGVRKTDIIENLKHKAMETLTEQGIEDVKWFAISSYNKGIGHFDLLVSHMQKCLPAAKCESFILSLVGTLTDELIDKKYRYLKDRIHTTCLKSASAAAIPIPVLDMAINIGIISWEIEEYRKAFGFEEDRVIELAKKKRIQKNLHKDSLLQQKGIDPKQFIVGNLLGFNLLALQNSVDIFLPIIGSIISSGTAYMCTYSFLNRLLDQCRDDAKVIYAHIAEIQSLDKKI